MRGSKTHQFSMVDGAPSYAGFTQSAPSISCGFAREAAPGTHYASDQDQHLAQSGPSAFIGLGK